MMKAASIRRAAEDAPCQGHETSWIDGALKPAYKGPYQRKIKIVGREWFWSIWDGSRWMRLASTAQEAQANAKAGRVSIYQLLPWRGCSRPPPSRRGSGGGAKREIKKGDYFLLPFAGELPELLVRAVAFNATTGHWAVKYACGNKQASVLLQSCHPCTPQRAQRIIHAWMMEPRK